MNRGAPDMQSDGTDTRSYLIAAALGALVAAVYWHVGRYTFVDLDDAQYVLRNPHVQRGLTKEGFLWAFTALQASNWHPLTWLSYMADVELFGVDAGWHHIVNVLWHGLDAVLLFWVLQILTGKAWRSAFAAALFAVHPLHVESVAWIAERKDVLSTFFWLVTMAAYVRYVRRPSLGRYLCVASAFALGLMSKPMLVTVPLVLLLLDVWPLGRVSPEAMSLRSMLPLVREKIPLLSLSAASCVVTYIAQAGKAAVSVEHLPLLARIENALISYASYLLKTIWPTSLAMFYPHPGLAPGGISGWQVAAAALVLAGISSVVAWQWKRRPFLAVGWLWYLVTLVPVIGLVQVGLQGMADRYTYVPLIGIFVALTWAAAEAAETSRFRRYALAGLGAILLLAAGVSARIQAGYWRDSFTLFKHASEVNPDNWFAWKNLGVRYYHRGQFAQATQAFQEALRTRPDDADLWMNLAFMYGNVGQHSVAAGCLEKAVQIVPDDEEAWFNLGIAYAMVPRPERVTEVVERLRAMSPGRAQDLIQRIRELQARR